MSTLAVKVLAEILITPLGLSTKGEKKGEKKLKMC
jgi:hypothetical protein